MQIFSGLSLCSSVITRDIEIQAKGSSQQQKLSSVLFLAEKRNCAQKATVLGDDFSILENILGFSYLMTLHFYMIIVRRDHAGGEIDFGKYCRKVFRKVFFRQYYGLKLQ